MDFAQENFRFRAACGMIPNLETDVFSEVCVISCGEA